VLQCVAVCCGVLQALHYVTLWKGCDYVVCCSVLQCVAVCSSVFQCVPVCSCVLQALHCAAL